MLITEPSINAAPIVGHMHINRISNQATWTSVSSGMDCFPPSGNVQDMLSSLRECMVPENRPQFDDFIDYLCKNGSGTISPLTVRFDTIKKVVGIYGPPPTEGVLVLTILDLTKTFTGASERYTARERVSTSVLRTMEWIGKSHSSSQSFAYVLDELLGLSGADLGFIGEIEKDSDGNPALVITAISDIAWDHPAKQLYSKVESKGFRFDNPELLFSPTFQRGEVLISNDYDKDSRAFGLPLGHPPVINFLSFPISVKNKQMGMVALANKEGGFSLEDYEVCRLYLNQLVGSPALVNPFEKHRSGWDTSKQKEIDEAWRMLDNLEVPALVLEGTKIRIATNEVGRRFGCLPSHLVDFDLAKQPNTLSLTMVTGEESDDVESLFALGTASPSPVSVLKLSGAGVQPRYFRLNGIDRVPVHGSGRLHLIREVSKEVRSYRKRRIAAQHAQETLRLQSSITKMISHELRTPLSSLQTAVELIEMRTTLPELKEHFETVYKMVGQMTSHMDSVLMLGNLNGDGDEGVVSIPEDLCSIVQEVIDVPDPEVRSRIRFLAPGDSEGPFFAEIDRSMVLVVLRNVLSNALKFSTDEVDVSLQEEGSSDICIRVTDRGIGIPKQEVDDILRPFRRGSNVAHHAGTGIGLTIANMMMRKMKAVLRVNSKLGRGTEVCLLFNRSAT